MANGFKDTELLAYVEERLPPRRAAALESRLAGDPGSADLARRLRRMREDRRRLRSIAPPPLPVDFVAELEPQLARLMLIDAAPPVARPGAYRRRHRRVTLRVFAAQLAVAAMVVVAAGAGLWALVHVVARSVAPPEPGEIEVAAAMPVSPPSPGAARIASPGVGAAIGLAVGPVVAPAEEPWPPPRTLIHHRGPLPPGPDPAGGGVRSLVDGREAPEPSLAAAGFVLVLPADSLEEGEALLTRLARELGAADAGADDRSRAASAALVRNFSFAEARRLLIQFQGRGGAAAPPDLIAGVSDPSGSGAGAAESDRRRRRLANVLRRLRRELPAGADRPPLSRRILGPVELAPDYEQQLAFASGGAHLAQLFLRFSESRPARCRHFAGPRRRIGRRDRRPRARRRPRRDAAGGRAVRCAGRILRRGKPARRSPRR